MVFWRSKSAKEQDGEEAAKKAVPPPQPETAKAADSGDGEEASAAPSNVVAMTSGRLADRLSEVSVGRGNALNNDDDALVSGSDPLILPGQSKPLSQMRETLADRRGNAHLLILGAEGTGRRWAAEKLAILHAEDMALQRDVLYVPDPDKPSRLVAFSFEAGEGIRFARDIQSALAKSWSARARILESDDHRLAVNLLDEEVRHRGDAAIEHLRRRAEQQNIALVRSIDGYVLAPMHEGRMVRPEIFRALPEALQRDVEAKISILEGELHSLVAASPDAEIEATEKYAALDRHVAMTAVKSNIAVIRKLYPENVQAARAIDQIERLFLDAAEAQGSLPQAAGPAPIIVATRDEATESLAVGGAPVIVARNVSRAALLGAIGRDAFGGIAVAPGSLMQANGGFLIVEAWRLAADGAGWSTLSEVIDTGRIAPECVDGLAILADTVPFTAKIIVIADPKSLEKLKEIDPGVEARFRHVAKFADTAATSDVSEAAFAAAAATLARDHGLRDIQKTAGPVLYEDAIKRGGGRVSMDRAHLLHLLEDADGRAASASADHIRSSDLNRAIAHATGGRQA